MDTTLLLTIIFFCLVGGVFSLIGGLLLLWKTEFTKKIILHLLTFAAGTLLAVSLFDLMPEALEFGGGNLATVQFWMLVGIVVFFVAELFLRRQHHHLHHGLDKEVAVGRGSAPWLITIGDALHNFIDGVAIAAAFLISVPTGIVTALAVAAHEIPQEISDFSILLHAGWTKRQVLLWNVGVALTTVLGGVVAYLLKNEITPLLGPLLAFAAGMFIYIALSNLIPEIHLQAHRQVSRAHIFHVIIALFVGLGLTWWVITATHTEEAGQFDELDLVEENSVNFSS